MNLDKFFSISPRIYGAISVNIILFIASLVFTKINTDPWQDAFYYLTLASAIIFNSNDSIFQGAFASLIGRFPEKYMSSLALGKHFIIDFQWKKEILFRPSHWRDSCLCYFSFYVGHRGQ